MGNKRTFSSLLVSQFTRPRHLSPAFQHLRGCSGFEKLSPVPSKERSKTLEHLPRLAYGVYYRFDGAIENLYILRPGSRELAFAASVLKLSNNLTAEAGGQYVN